MKYILSLYVRLPYYYSDFVWFCKGHFGRFFCPDIAANSHCGHFIENQMEEPSPNKTQHIVERKSVHLPGQNCFQKYESFLQD